MVLDASAAIRALVDRDAGAIEWMSRLEDARVRGFAPDLFFIELGNAMVRAIRAGNLAPEEAREHLELTRRLPVRIFGLAELTAPSMSLALARRLTVYDACYAVLAEIADAVLVTADERLAAAATRAELLPS